jgi:hypothetical protein
MTTWFSPPLAVGGNVENGKLLIRTESIIPELTFFAKQNTALWRNTAAQATRFDLLST